MWPDAEHTLDLKETAIWHELFVPGLGNLCMTVSFTAVTDDFKPLLQMS